MDAQVVLRDEVDQHLVVLQARVVAHSYCRAVDALLGLLAPALRAERHVSAAKDLLDHDLVFARAVDRHDLIVRTHHNRDQSVVAPRYVKRQRDLLARVHRVHYELPRERVLLHRHLVDVEQVDSVRL